tara:strand:- start:20862 stop:21665 length:804 start_codon:yes stop_codon:yes gene_type:complete
MAFWIHPAWKDIFLKVREEMGDEIIYYYSNNNQNPLLRIPTFVKQPPISSKEIESLVFNPSTFPVISSEGETTKGLRNYDNLRFPLEINKKGIKRYLYTINWDRKDKRSDYSTPLKEIYFYDVMFLRAFNSMLYDALEYFEGDDEDISQIAELKNKIKNLCVQDWEKKYDRKWKKTSPHVNSGMQDILFLGYLGYPISFDDYDEWSWLMLQMVRYETWVEEINRYDSLSKKTPSSDLNPSQWFSKIWQSKIITKPFMNWDSSPFNKT